jgi:gluconate 5-dehydrogenase/3-oxoacyl-[acyl-carrier protein] reductase
MSLSRSTEAAGLKGARVLVLGATGTVGREVARAFAREGAHLALHGHNDRDVARRLADQLAEDHRVDTVTVTGDVTSPEEMAAMAAMLRHVGFSELDVLVNCVTGYRGEAASVADLDPAEFHRVLDVDLYGSFVAVQAIAPLLTGPHRASVVLFSSLAGVRGRPMAPHLCAAKAGVGGLTLALARDLQAQRVRVNCLAPGPIGPSFEGGSPASHAPPAPSSLPPGIGLTAPEQVAGTVLALSAVDSAMNGQVLVLNGGQP